MVSLELGWDLWAEAIYISGPETPSIRGFFKVATAG